MESPAEKMTFYLYGSKKNLVEDLEFNYMLAKYLLHNLVNSSEELVTY